MTKLRLPGVRRYAALAAIALGIALAPPASAVPLIAAGIYIETKSVSCPTTSTCHALFTAVPAGKTLIVRSATCGIFVLTTSARIYSYYLSGNGRTTFLEITPPVVLSNTNRYSLNSEVLVPLVAGQSPVIRFSLTSSAGVSMACTIAGELKS